MMMPWAWRHHQFRKTVANAVVHRRALEAGTGWHVTSDTEVQAIRSLGFAQPICVAPNSVNLPKPEELESAQDYWIKLKPSVSDHRVALFYSRFHSKKRVVECIELWSKIAPRDWILLLVGIPDEFTLRELDARVVQKGMTKSIKVHDGSLHPAPYSVSEIFLLPTHSENFGMVIAESLASEVPALVTDGTPWLELADREAG
jgi:glycosyltransferase involved in cell wall biosynthesis